MAAQEINTQTANATKAGATRSDALSESALDLVVGGGGSGKATTPFPYGNRVRIVGTIAIDQAWG